MNLQRGSKGLTAITAHSAEGIRARPKNTRDLWLKNFKQRTLHQKAMDVHLWGGSIKIERNPKSLNIRVFFNYKSKHTSSRAFARGTKLYE